ncbi:MAG: hypothetical protein EOM52_00370 [Clostridia bacterium]|nr:hypothetical protein [Clostridia bacterium]
MGKGEKRVFLSVLAVLLVSLAFMLMQSATGANTPRIFHVSVLMDGTGDDYSRSFKKGVEQAAVDSNADVRYISHYEGSAAEAQAAALRGEWEGEADGVVIVPVNGDALALALIDAPQQLAVTISGPNVVTEHTAAYITMDNRATGAKLAEAVYESGTKACTVFLPLNAGTAVSERYEGFGARLDELGVSHGMVETVDPSGELLAPGYALVALEPTMAEALCELPAAAGRVYGIGTSNRLLRNLEDGAAAALVVQSDYSAGYLSLMSVIGRLKGVTQKDITLESYTVTKDNMFTEPLVQMLFPIN